MALDEPVELAGHHTFRLRLHDDIYRKMGRELAYFREAGSDRNRRVDHAVNFAITAWHYTDWVWKWHADRLRDTGIACSLSGFQTYIRADCRELAVCDVIANAVKHGGTAHPKDGRPNVETILIAEPVDVGLPPVELVMAAVQRGWKLKIVVDGKHKYAEVVLGAAYRYWHGFRNRHLKWVES